jgi:dTDP-4-amino-4,6-dideoxygalactose transaminase
MIEKIRLSKSIVGEEEMLALGRIIDAGYLGMGPEVQLFEEDIRRFLKTSNEVICVNSGTAALHLALQALDIGPGDEVLVPSITYLATFQAVSATGAKPIACDVCFDRVFIDLNDAKQRVTSKTKAIIPVHYASSSEGMEKVFEFARNHRLRVIEDAAHSFGCSRNGRKVGALGDISCFSFDGIKNITSGEGGAVVTGDQDVARKIKDARLLGVEKDTDNRYSRQRSWTFNVTEQGWRYHMSNLMAAIGRVQLKKIYNFGISRRSIASAYYNRFKVCSSIKLLDIKYDGNNIIPHIFPIRVLNGLRDSLMSNLNDKGVETGFHYYPNHLHKKFFSSCSLPVTVQLTGELISLPLHPGITQDQVEYIIDIVVKELG